MKLFGKDCPTERGLYEKLDFVQFVNNDRVPIPPPPNRCTFTIIAELREPKFANFCPENFLGPIFLRNVESIIFFPIYDTIQSIIQENFLVGIATWTT